MLSFKNIFFIHVSICRHRNFMETIVVAKVDNVVWDLERPLEKDCKLQFLFFTDKEGTSRSHPTCDFVRWESVRF